MGYMAIYAIYPEGEIPPNAILKERILPNLLRDYVVEFLNQVSLIDITLLGLRFMSTCPTSAPRQSTTASNW